MKLLQVKPAMPTMYFLLQQLLGCFKKNHTKEQRFLVIETKPFCFGWLNLKFLSFFSSPHLFLFQSLFPSIYYTKNSFPFQFTSKLPLLASSCFSSNPTVSKNINILVLTTISESDRLRSKSQLLCHVINGCYYYHCQ